MNDDSRLSNDTELSDAELACVHGGLPSAVIDPTPTLSEETLRKLHEQLNEAGVRGV